MKTLKAIIFTALTTMLFTSFAKEPTKLYIVEDEIINNIDISYSINGIIEQDFGTPSLNNE